VIHMTREPSIKSGTRSLGKMAGSDATTTAMRLLPHGEGVGVRGGEEGLSLVG
jgi:hypothetical protein